MPVHTPRGRASTPMLGLVDLYSKVVFGGSGAVSSQTALGVSGFTFSKPAGTGIYRLTFDDNWDKMVWINGILYNAGTAKGGQVELKVKLGAVTAKVADIHLVIATSAADATSGDELWLHVVMSNSGHGPQV